MLMIDYIHARLSGSLEYLAHVNSDHFVLPMGSSKKRRRKLPYSYMEVMKARSENMFSDVPHHQVHCKIYKLSMKIRSESIVSDMS